MIRRLVFSVSVLGATAYWANCGFEVPGVPLPAPNAFFAGCFQGPITDPPGQGNATLVLEATPGDSALLTGCARWATGIGDDANGTIAGTVLEDRQQVRAAVTPQAGPVFTLLVRRGPDGNVDATTVTLTNDGGAPFNSAANLVRCSPQRTCQDLAFRVPFLPGGGAQ